MPQRFSLLFLFGLAIIIAPLYIIRSHLGFLPTTLLEQVLWLTVALTILDFFRTRSKLSLLRTGFDLNIGLFLLAAILATILSQDKIGGLGILKAYFIEPIAFFYCLVYAFHRYQSKLQLPSFIIHSLIGSGLWLGLLGLIQKLTHSYSLAPQELKLGRITAVYNSANALALYLGPISLLCLSLALKSKGIKKLLLLTTFIFFCLIMLWTRSKGGMIAEIISLAIFLFAFLAHRYHYLRKYLVTVLGVSIAATFIFLAVSFSNFIQHSNMIFESGDTLEIRFLIWQGTFQMLHDHPIFGAGLNGFKTLYSQNYKPYQYPEAFQYPHNILLTFWAECGILGLIAFILLIFKLFDTLISNLSSKDIFLGAGLIASFVYIIIHGSVDEPYFKNDLSLEFWTLVALTQMWRKI